MYCCGLLIFSGTKIYLLYTPRLSGPDSVPWLLFQFHTNYSEGRVGAMDLAPDLLRIKQCCFVFSPPFERQQKGLGTWGTLPDNHMCCMNHPVGCAIFVSVTLWYHPFSSHGERILALVHLQVKCSESKPGTYRTSLPLCSLASHWNRTELSPSSSFQK